MDLIKLKELIKVIDNSSVTKFAYKDDEVEISIGKSECLRITEADMSNISNTYTAAGRSCSNEASQDIASEDDDDSQFITSSLVGTFYSSTDPEVPAFVKAGDKVKKGQIVCMLEAMKLMTELRSECDCQIEEVLAENGQKVEYGQRLFRIKKL